jgi:hypothetical protein
VSRLWRHHINTPAVQQSRELALDADEVETRNMAGLKLHQDAVVTVGAEIVPKDGAEQSQPCDVMPPAERRHRVTID